MARLEILSDQIYFLKMHLTLTLIEKVEWTSVVAPTVVPTAKGVLCVLSSQ
jgi:hypothetical protein